MAEHRRVAVIGAGFGGLGAAVRLKQAGITDFTVLERAGSVGGTWRDNTYPGCTCDVPSHLYSFSFAPNPDWPRSYSGQPDIRAYLERVTDRFGVRPHIRFDSPVTDARWDDGERRWYLNSGALSADVLVSATGPLAEPSIPALPGLAGFPGEVFHSARWNHDVELAGKRVAVVGTGASAVQFVPEIAPVVGELHVFQRTPAWVLPRSGRAFSDVERDRFRRFPAYQQLVRGLVYASREALVPGYVREPALLKVGELAAAAHLKSQVPDPALRAALTPDYRLGCKRVLLSNDFYPALTRPNVSLVASGVRSVEGSTVVGADGSRREVDVIIFGTGFHTTDLPVAHHIRGRDGTLAEAWASGMQALRSTTVAGFPNLFLLIGPNSGLGHNSMVYIIESQLNYLSSALSAMAHTGAVALEPRADVQAAWNGMLQRRMTRTVWSTGGCASWYQDAAGRNTTLWPGSTMAFRRATRRVNLREYRLYGRRPALEPAVTG